VFQKAIQSLEAEEGTVESLGPALFRVDLCSPGSRRMIGRVSASLQHLRSFVDEVSTSSSSRLWGPEDVLPIISRVRVIVLAGCVSPMVTEGPAYKPMEVDPYAKEISLAHLPLATKADDESFDRALSLRFNLFMRHCRHRLISRLKRLPELSYRDMESIPIE